MPWYVTLTAFPSPSLYQLPEVCGYQYIRYWVTVRSPNSELLYKEGPYDQLYSEAPVVQVSIAQIEQLRTSQYIIAEATFGVIGIEEEFGNNISATNSFSKYTWQVNYYEYCNWWDI